MDNIEIMNKLNNIFIEASANDIIDVFEANEYISETIDLFSPDYICEAEESYMTDEEKAAKERAKKTRKKIIKSIAICTALLSAILSAIAVTKKIVNNRALRRQNQELQKELKERRQDVLNIKKELRKYLNKDTITIDELNNLNNLTDELTYNRIAINSLIAEAKRWENKNYNLMKNENNIMKDDISLFHKVKEPEKYSITVRV